MTTIFLDECGHTGQDLLNKEQPFFVLASLTLEEEECAALKRLYFHRVQARELKHSSLSKSKAHQQAVLSFLTDLKTKPNFFKLGVTHKKYALVCKVVDLVIEPYMYENGFDLYDKGANIATANLFYLTMPVFGGEQFFEDLLARFQNLIRLKTAESYNGFFELIFKEYDSDHLNEELNMLRLAHFYLGHRIFDTLPENSLDVAFTQAMLIMATWRKEIEGEMNLVHDASSNMSKQKHIWDALMSPDLPPATVGYDRRKMTFPIAVTQTSFERSEDWVGLQLADVVAGAFARSATWFHVTQDPNDEYGRDLTAIIGDIPVLPLLPGTEITPDELGAKGDNAGDPNEHLAKILHDASNKIKP